MDDLERLTAAFLAICMAFMIFFAVEACNEWNSWNEAHGSTTELQVLQAVKRLQPAHPPTVAASWAGVIYEAGRETSIDPLLIVSIAFKESSLRNSTTGARGEIGAMQIHGAAMRYMPRACRGNARDMRCNIRAGSAVLQYWRAECGDERWAVWIYAYGAGRCPTSYDEAASHQSVRNARRIYDRVGGTQWID